MANNWLTEEINNKQPKPSTLNGWNIAVKTLLNEFTGYPIAEITPKQILNLCKQLSSYNANRTKGIARRIFAYAVVHGIVEHNPVLELQGTSLFKQKKGKEYPALVKPNEFACLLNDIDNIDSIKKTFNKAILQLLALTFVRIGDLCAMKWGDIDLDTKQWIFSPQKSGNRGDMVKSLVIPLAPQAIAIIKDMQQITGDKEYVFYNSRRKKEPYHDHQRVRDTLNSSLMNRQGIGEKYQTDKGYLGVHCPHGFRATAKTMLMERLGYDHLITEIQLGHAMPDKYGLSYSRMELIRERTKMMIEWANYLDDLKNTDFGKVAYLKVKDSQSIKTG